MDNPEIIYLIKYDKDGKKLKDEEVLWCEDDINGNGIEYKIDYKHRNKELLKKLSDN